VDDQLFRIFLHLSPEPVLAYDKDEPQEARTARRSASQMQTRLNEVSIYIQARSCLPEVFQETHGKSSHLDTLHTISMIFAYCLLIHISECDAGAPPKPTNPERVMICFQPPRVPESFSELQGTLLMLLVKVRELPVTPYSYAKSR
jgi:hypothetical protein